MNTIDFTTCTMADVIQHSRVYHPSLFAEALRDKAEIHEAAAREMECHDRVAAGIALLMATTLRDAAVSVVRDCNPAVSIPVFATAARLNLVPSHLMDGIMGRGDGRKWWAARKAKVLGPFVSREAAARAGYALFPMRPAYRDAISTGHGEAGPHLSIQFTTASSLSPDAIREARAAAAKPSL